MKILHLYKDYCPVLGGIENHIKILAEAQAADGDQVTVLVCDPGQTSHSETLNGVQVFKAGRFSTVASMPISLAQPLHLARCRPDIVHVHSPYPLGEAANWLLKPGHATVITHHSDVVRQKGWLRLYGPLLRRVLRQANRIIATSPRYIDSSPWLNPLRTKCTVIPLGVDLARFQPVARPDNPRPVLLFVGRLRYYKGLGALLKALPDVPAVRLNVVGDGPMKPTWQALAASLELTDRVHFAGDVTDADLPGWYQRADLFTLPATARSEAFGNVMLEAMACGLPCITTEVGSGTSWVVQDGLTGLVVSPNDPPALAEAIKTLVDNPALRQQFGQAGLSRARDTFSNERLIERVKQVYSQVLA
jgi:rhamnosyl/mannosyltransferase